MFQRIKSSFLKTNDLDLHLTPKDVMRSVFIWSIAGILCGFLWIFHYAFMETQLGIRGNQVRAIYGLLDGISSLTYAAISWRMFLDLLRAKTWYNRDGTISQLERKKLMEHYGALAVLLGGAVILSTLSQWAMIRYVLLGHSYGGFAWIYELAIQALLAAMMAMVGLIVATKMIKNIRAELVRGGLAPQRLPI